MRLTSMRPCVFRRLGIPLLMLAIWLTSASQAAQRPTDKQLEALATRVGKTFWVVEVNKHLPSFLTAPAPNSASFQPKANESFDINELVGRDTPTPYYKVRFESGRDGYIRPEAFHEEFNSTIQTADPQAEAREKAEKAAEEEKERLAWINSQPWSAGVKDAAIKRKPVPGLGFVEARRIMGAPTRVVKTRGSSSGNRQSGTGVREERWTYADGTLLVFTNGILARVEEKPQPPK